MSKKKWTNIKILGAEINAMREAGKSRQEIADYFGLDKVQIKNWVHRYNKEVKRTVSGIVPRPKGRPRKDGKPSRQNEERTGTASHGKQAVAGFSAIHRKEVRPKVKHHVML